MISSAEVIPRDNPPPPPQLNLLSLYMRKIWPPVTVLNYSLLYIDSQETQYALISLGILSLIAIASVYLMFTSSMYIFSNSSLLKPKQGNTCQPASQCQGYPTFRRETPLPLPELSRLPEARSQSSC